MAAEIQKNEVVAGKRQIDVEVWKDGALVPGNAGTDFIGSGLVYVPDPANLPNYKLATGTFVQKRRPLVVADDVVESVDTGADTLTFTAHAYETGDGPFFADETIGGVSYPGPIGVYTIKVDANTIAVATSIADAFNDVRIALSGTEGGATITSDISLRRAIPSWFTYTFTQPETNVSLSELSVLVDGPNYARLNNGGGYATAALVSSAADMWSVTTSDGLTNQQKLTLAACFAGAKFIKVGNVYTWRKLDDSGDAFTMTVVAGGRTVFTVIDLD